MAVFDHGQFNALIDPERAAVNRERDLNSLREALANPGKTATAIGSGVVGSALGFGGMLLNGANRAFLATGQQGQPQYEQNAQSIRENFTDRPLAKAVGRVSDKGEEYVNQSVDQFPKLASGTETLVDFLGVGKATKAFRFGNSRTENMPRLLPQYPQMVRSFKNGKRHTRNATWRDNRHVNNVAPAVAGTGYVVGTEALEEKLGD
jgi:hypothetical protein